MRFAPKARLPLLNAIFTATQPPRLHAAANLAQNFGAARQDLL